jgi:hypothetical protein
MPQAAEQFVLPKNNSRRHRTEQQDQITIIKISSAGIAVANYFVFSLLLNQPSLERDFSFPEYPCREEFQEYSALARLRALAAQFPVLVSWVQCP